MEDNANKDDRCNTDEKGAVPESSGQPKKAPLYRRISPVEQLGMMREGKPFLYKMRIRFKADAGIDEINDILAAIGDQGRLVGKDAVTLYIEQTCRFVPDWDALKQYAGILEQGHSRNGISLSNTHFDGYEYFYAVVPEDMPESCGAYAEEEPESSIEIAD